MTSAQGAVYNNAIEGLVAGLPTGVSTGSFALKSGYALVNNAGGAVVHNATVIAWMWSSCIQSR